ncbi:MAG: HTH domain-containing protein [Candidatus Bathyarchaeia archaeon]|nr:HTH domain-containing protein [Candidatus Bathyarchaeota archaeon]MBS7628519.1 HTH domain-containing protein [Candidatus Bathyarchaeota archaeon]MBS7651317.1 HTH domain-containing protein [Candidatus Bathyarchaeota archaeon]
MKLIDIFQSRATVKLIEYMLENRGKIFNQSLLANILNVSPSTVSRVIEPLVKEQIILFDRFDKGMKLISLNEQSERTRALIEFHDKIKRL